MTCPCCGESRPPTLDDYYFDPISGDNRLRPTRAEEE